MERLKKKDALELKRKGGLTYEKIENGAFYV